MGLTMTMVVEGGRDTKRRVAALRNDGSDNEGGDGKAGVNTGLSNVVGREEEGWVGDDSKVMIGQDYY